MLYQLAMAYLDAVEAENEFEANLLLGELLREFRRNPNERLADYMQSARMMHKVARAARDPIFAVAA